jgi:hypothetical protein
MPVFDQLVSTIPVMATGGVTMMTADYVFNRNGCATPGRRICSGGYGCGLVRGRRCDPIGMPRYYKRRSLLGFGDFSNVGIY